LAKANLAVVLFILDKYDECGKTIKKIREDVDGPNYEFAMRILEICLNFLISYSKEKGRQEKLDLYNKSSSNPGTYASLTKWPFENKTESSMQAVLDLLKYYESAFIQGTDASLTKWAFDGLIAKVKGSNLKLEIKQLLTKLMLLPKKKENIVDENAKIKEIRDLINSENYFLRKSIDSD